MPRRPWILYRRLTAACCLVVVLGGLPGWAYGESEQRSLVIKKVEEYPSHQVTSELAIAVQPYYSDDICNAVFEHKDLVSEGILPLLVVVENRGKSTLQLDGRDIFLTRVRAAGGNIAPLEFREVMGRLQKKGKSVSIPLPIPRGVGKVGGLDRKLDELRARAFEQKLIPAAQNDYGFVYYSLPKVEILNEIENIYMPEITNVETREKLMFFEISLRPALEGMARKGPSPARKPPGSEDGTSQHVSGAGIRAMGFGFQPAPIAYGGELRAEEVIQVPATEQATVGEKALIVPKKSEIVMGLLSFITTRTAMPGDKFYGQVTIPVVVDDRMVIPVNSYIVGVVEHAKRAGRIRGNAELALDFKSVILPSGETRSIEARVRAADGYKSADIQQSEGTIKKEPQKGKDLEEGARNASIGAGLGSIIVGSTARNLRGVAYGGIGGAVTGLGLTLLKRGADLELEKGTQITLVLDQDIVLTKRQ